MVLLHSPSNCKLTVAYFFRNGKFKMTKTNEKPKRTTVSTKGPASAQVLNELLLQTGLYFISNTQNRLKFTPNSAKS